MMRLGKWDDPCVESEGGGAQPFLVGSHDDNNQVDANEREVPGSCGNEDGKDDDVDLENDGLECVAYWVGKEKQTAGPAATILSNVTWKQHQFLPM